MIDEEDPEGLFEGVKDYNICEDCGKKIKKEYKKCYNCYLEEKDKEDD